MKPEEAEEDNNFLYNYRMLGRRWEPEGSPERPPVRTEEVARERKPPRTSRSPRRQPSTDDKAALIAGTPTSQMSLSSSGGDSAEAPPALPHHPNFTPYVRRDDLDPTGTLISPQGGHGDVISYNDLLPGPARDSRAVQNGRLRQGDRAEARGPDDLYYSQETSFKGPLPILTPISSSHDPVFKARGFRAMPSATCDSGQTSSQRPSTLEPLNREHSEHRKKHRKRRKHPSQHNHVAMETISHDAAEIVPIRSGESNA